MIVHGPHAITAAASLPWKNGGGTTRTLVTSPADAGLDDFAWRLSLAEISADAAFSPFPGVDRTIMLWRGNGVLLRNKEGIDHALTRLYEPYQFEGEASINAQMVSGPTIDLNLMLRRGLVDGHLQRYDAEHQYDGTYDDLIVLCAAGSLQVIIHGNQVLHLNSEEFLHLHAPTGVTHLIPDAPQTVYVVASLRLAECE